MPDRPLTDKQRECLATIGSPYAVLLSADADDMRRYRALAKRGLVQNVSKRPGGEAYKITPAGLRSLAEMMDAGRFPSKWSSGPETCD